MLIKLQDQSGGLIIEFLVALGVASVLIIGGLEVVDPSLRVEQMSKENERVSAIIQEQFEIIRSIRNENWNALFPVWPIPDPGCETDTYHYIDDENGLSLAPCSQAFGKYEVIITFHEVYRDSSQNIILIGGTDDIDKQTVEVNVEINWDSYGRAKSESQSIYLTDWGGF